MKNKHHLSIVPAAILLTFSTASPAADAGSWFIGAQAGQSKLTGMPDVTMDHDTHTASALSGGYRWNINPSFDIGVELGYVDLGNYSGYFYAGHVPAGGPTSGTLSAKVRGAFGGVNARFSFDSRWYATIRGGVFNTRNQVHALVPDIYLDNTFSDHHSSWYSGVGAGYRVNDHVSVGLALDHYQDKFDSSDLSSNLISVRLEVQF